MFSQKDNTPLAVGIIVVTVLLLALGDAAVKGFSGDLRLWQMFVLRSSVALPVLFLILIVAYSQVPMMPVARTWVIIRSLMLTFMWVAYYASLPHLDLSVAAATYYTLPIFITVFSALFAGERVKATGWIAVLLGFSGVLIILRPASGDFNFYALLPLVSAVLYALAMILTRTKCREEHPLILSAALNVSFVVVGLLATLVLTLLGGDTLNGTFLAPDWSPLSGDGLVALCLMAVAILIGSIGAAIAYQIGRSSVIATFDFSYVAFATIWGIIFFGENPDGWTITGMAVVVIAGILAVRK